MPDNPNYAICTILYIIAHLVGVGALVFVGLWIDYKKDGSLKNIFQSNSIYFRFGFHDQPDLEFKFHPILMSLSLLFLNGEAIMIYRGLRFWPKWLTKFIHATLHTVSFTFMVLGLKASGFCYCSSNRVLRLFGILMIMLEMSTAICHRCLTL